MRQSCRPKHQALVLKCYPRFQKNAVDVKPNSSELSYLLYYVSTRRTKVQKVGAFMERTTASDVWRGRLGNVQVTCQILKALIEKSTRDLPLFALSVLKILDIILRSKDLTMVEYSIPTFQTFCAHHDGALLAGDQAFLSHYQDIVRTYASFASDPATQSKAPISPPVALRWRGIGLQAIQSIASSDALGTDGGRQLRVILPVILQNLDSDEDDHLQTLQQLAQLRQREQAEGEKVLKRRTSIATAQTADTSEARPTAASTTTADADKIAEEDIGVVALASLKQIFLANSRLQIRMATAVTLDFISRRTSTTSNALPYVRASAESSGGWSTTLIEMVAQWAAVQDRYVILVTAMETLVRSPVVEGALEQQLVLASLIGWLLSSNVNLIGLSVMDVLVGLVQHIMLLLQLGGKGSSIQPHPQQTQAIGTEHFSKEVSRHASSASNASKKIATETVATPSTQRLELLSRLQKCIGDLATHIYYSDQISDMTSAILLRLKPSLTSGVGTAAGAIENPVAAARAISTSANLHESTDTDAFFSFDTARVIALQAIKEVLTVANMRASSSGNVTVGRNRVGFHVWEGTQWLLRDPDPRVRKAYVDAILTWLKLEVSKDDLQRLEEHQSQPNPSHPREQDDLSGANLTRRAASNATKAERSRPARSTFLQLLHLAVYESALQHAESDTETVLLHILLAHLVTKLGVNAVTSGLPMIMRLQEEIPEVETPTAKVRIGSLVHGYFWLLSDKFDFDVSSVGSEIHREIVRRKSRGMWTEQVQVPPGKLDVILSTTSPPKEETLPIDAISSEALRPFDRREAMVDRIAFAYTASLESPPGSPPSSPGRKYSMASFNGPSGNLRGRPQMPVRVKEQMLSEWSREAIVAACDNDTSQAASLNGSRTGTTRSHFLTVNAANGGTNGNGSQTTPTHHHHHHHHHHSRPPSVNVYGNGAGAGLGAIQKKRQGSLRDGSPTFMTSSSRSSTVRVSELKRVLSGQVGIRGFTRGRDTEPHSPSTSTESMVTAEGSLAESTLTESQHASDGPNVTNGARQSFHARPRSSDRSNTDDTIRPGDFTQDSTSLALGSHAPVLPPVPSLPPTLSISTPPAPSPRTVLTQPPSPLEARAPGRTASTRTSDGAKKSRTSLSYRPMSRDQNNGVGVGAFRYSEVVNADGGIGGGVGGGAKVDLKSLLGGIGADEGELNTSGRGTGAEVEAGGDTPGGGVGKPPY